MRLQGFVLHTTEAGNWTTYPPFMSLCMTLSIQVKLPMLHLHVVYYLLLAKLFFGTQDESHHRCYRMLGRETSIRTMKQNIVNSLLS